MNSTPEATFGSARCCRAFAFCLALAFSQTSFGDGLSKLKGVMQALAKGAPNGNLIVNGSFEEPVVPKGSYQLFSVGQSFPGWQVMGAAGNVAPISGAYAKNGITFPAQRGKQWLDITGLSNSATGVQQTVRTQAGTRYELAFFVGNVVNGGGFGSTSVIEVLVDGQSAGVFKHDGGSPRLLDWRQFTVPVTATATSTTIAFVNRDSGGDDSNGLDSVSLRPAGQAAPPASANVALKGIASQSSTAYDGPQYNGSGPASRANDGNTDGEYNHGSVSHTGQQQGWWQVKLDQPYALDSVKIWNRTDSYSSRITPFTVSVYLDKALVTSVPHNVMPASNVIEINLDGAVGDRVRVEMEHPDWLHMAEVQVFGKPNEALRSVNGDYTYLVPGFPGQGLATVTQIENEVHIYTTWTPMGKGPHAEFKGKLRGDTITGEWYSLRTKQGWFKFVGQVRPNGDIDFSQSDDPINSNTKKVVLTKAR